MKNRPNKLLDQLIASQTARGRKDIRQWRTAIQAAENVENPNRSLLYNIYDEIDLDSHLTNEIQKRILAVKGARFAMYKDDDSIDADATKLFRKPWFYQFIDLAMQSIFWGHSLIQIDELKEDGSIKKLKLVDRKHVVPERGLFKIRQNDDKGILYREDKKFSGWLIEVGETKNFGLLNKAVPHILYKRFAQAAWSEYCEIFGMPLRIGKTNVKDDESLYRMEQMLLNMATAAYGIVDDEEEIEFIESQRTDGSLYSGLLNFCNAEISKLINSAVIGEASQGGSRSKEEVGQDIGEKLTKADKQWLEGFINEDLKPILISFGYPDLEFQFEKGKNLEALWKITSGLLTHYDIDEEYISETFGVPVKAKKQPPANGGLSADRFF